MGIYDDQLETNEANNTALSPISFLRRAAQIYPTKAAVVHGSRSLSWLEVWQRSVAVARALRARDIGEGDTVAILSANIPEMFEAHFSVPMCGAVLNAINIRLDAATIAFILAHGEAKLFIVDKEFSEVAAAALAELPVQPQLVHIDDTTCLQGSLLGTDSYEDLVAEGAAAVEPNEPVPVPVQVPVRVPVDAREFLPADEWDAISLNYTSGTTGNQKAWSTIIGVPI